MVITHVYGPRLAALRTLTVTAAIADYEPWLAKFGQVTKSHLQNRKWCLKRFAERFGKRLPLLRGVSRMVQDARTISRKSRLGVLPCWELPVVPQTCWTASPSRRPGQVHFFCLGTMAFPFLWLVHRPSSTTFWFGSRFVRTIEANPFGPVVFSIFPYNWRRTRPLGKCQSGVT